MLTAMFDFRHHEIDHVVFLQIAEEEETEMFPKARKAMGAARLRELGEELKRRKQELRGRLSRPTTAAHGRYRRRAA
jgi:hypothetical protein